MSRPPRPTLALKTFLLTSGGRSSDSAKGRSAKSKVLVKSISSSAGSGGGGSGGTTTCCIHALPSCPPLFFFLLWSSDLKDSRMGLAGKRFAIAWEAGDLSFSASLALESCSANFLVLTLACPQKSWSVCSWVLFGSWWSLILSLCRSHWQHTKSLFLRSLRITHSSSSLDISMFSRSSFNFSKLCTLFSRLLLVCGLCAFSLGLNTL
mmetsp:Transcript_7837/g.28416  ORF Transcript_7837/g.28416 Transcript_7837/m.28416 type:complete len:208 (-) Transcript_7837:343-966(-)